MASLPMRPRIPMLANRLDGLRPRAGEQQDGAAFVAESSAHGLGEVPLVRLGEQVGAVHEKHESRRRLPNLRRVKEL